jgi:hypothetical protein
MHFCFICDLFPQQYLEFYVETRFHLLFVPKTISKILCKDKNWKSFGTIEMVEIGIYGRSTKTFILVVANGLEAVDTHALHYTKR